MPPFSVLVSLAVTGLLVAGYVFLHFFGYSWIKGLFR